MDHLYTEDGLYRDHSDWAEAIGRLIIAFGEIEWFTYSLIIQLNPGSEATSQLKKPLKPRIEWVLSQMTRLNLNPDVADQIVSILNEAASFIEIRNAIAHNPMRISLYENEKGQHSLSHEITEFDLSEPPITFRQIDNARNRLEELVAECFFVHSQAMSS